MTDILKTLKASHPRLLVTDTSWDEIKAHRLQDPTLDAFLKHGELEARAISEVEPIAYKKDGNRLLNVSRTVLRRVILLAMQYRLTKNEVFSRRAQAEMVNVAAFADWNPSHFLDTAEMTLAVALGYDWLYDQLDENTRKTLSVAIVEKGLRPGLFRSESENWWIKIDNNWNSVCHAGLSLGALAIAEDEPVLAALTLQRAREFNPNGLKAYAPDGVYPEGAGYWSYGTGFQVVLLSALQSALGTDWNLSQSPGFMQTANALFQTMGPSGAFFNFSDGPERPSLQGGSYWFAERLNQPDLVRFEADFLKQVISKPAAPHSTNNRLLPLIALSWPKTQASNAPDQKPSELPLNWYGRGSNPLVSFRSSWNDPNAMFVAIKGGKASNNHGHMDAGSFIFESDGVRWARDLGAQSYLSLESKKIDLWDMGQDSGRWRVFRLNNFSHNTLTINNQLHRADGNAKITHFSAGKDAGAIVDLSPVFVGQAQRVTRGFSFNPEKNLLIRDEIEGLKAGDLVRFAMLTNAEIVISNDGQSANLTQDGKQLCVRLLSHSARNGVKFEIASAQPPQNSYDQPNPSAQLLIVNSVAPAKGNLDWTVELQPGTSPSVDENPLAAT